MPSIEDIEIGDQVFAQEGGEEFGAVRGITPDRTGLMIYIENAGDFVVPRDTIRSVHDHKVIVDCSRANDKLRNAIAHAHDREEPGL